MLRFLKAANRLRGRIESRAFDNAVAEPGKTQRRLLLDLLQRNSETEFGRMHGFREIRDEIEFRRRLPVREYEEFRPYIDRIANGEPSVLTKEAPFMLTMTSGTTDKPKFIPVTRRSQANSSSLMRQWLYRAECDHPGFTAKASLGIAGRAVEGFTASGLPYGSASGLLYKNIPRAIRQAFAVPYPVSEIEDYDQRYFVIARFALASRVSAIATPNPATLLRLAEVCSDNQERLVRAINDGTLGTEIDKQTTVDTELAAMLEPDGVRARELERVISKSRSLRLDDCWPDLRMVGCWQGGSVGVHSAKLGKIFGETPLRDLGYLASEGSFTLPVADGVSSGVLALPFNYFEFIPEEEIDSVEPNVLSAHELGIGNRYEILLTTAAGLYRYRINDIVEVTGFCRRTPLVAFIRKSGEMTNIAGEKMHANHLLEAFEYVSREFGLEIVQFRAVANSDNCRYEIFLELRDCFSKATLRNEVLPAIDGELQRVNIEYRQRRKSRRLGMPILYLMRRGWSQEGLRRHIAEGKRDIQYKPQVLCSEQAAADERFITHIIEVEISNAPQRFSSVSV